MSLWVWAAAAVLGGAAALARVLVGGAVAARLAHPFPVGTLAVNITGSLVLGVLVGAALRGDALTLAGTAMMGSYTTFSTWMFETQRLGEEGRRTAAVANAAISLLVGLAAIALGRTLGAHA